jgi:hypothetical protein
LALALLQPLSAGVWGFCHNPAKFLRRAALVGKSRFNAHICQGIAGKYHESAAHVDPEAPGVGDESLAPSRRFDLV